MRLLELFNKNVDAPLSSILGNEVEVTGHFKDRMAERGYNSAIVMNNLKRLMKKHRQKIQVLKPDGPPFILRLRDGSSISVAKQEVPDERQLVYKVKTIDPTLKLGHEQFSYIFDSAELDKPTPSVGEVAEKHHCSLMAVEQQLKKGIKHEMEHTNHYKVAREIALDHLGEDLYYYDKLDKVEKTNESCGHECACPKCKGKKKGK